MNGGLPSCVILDYVSQKIYATNLIVREYPCLFSMGNGIGLACMYGTQNKYG